MQINVLEISTWSYNYLQIILGGTRGVKEVRVV